MTISSLALSLTLLIALLAASLLFPSEAVAIAISSLILVLGMSIASILRREFQAYHAGGIGRRALLRNSLAKITGLLIQLALSVLLTRLVLAHPIGHTNGSAGMIIAICAALLISLTMSLLVRAAWNWIVK